MATGEDAQRELEQRALRNVRGLVDRMEDDEKLSRRAQKRTVVILVLAVVVAFGLILAFLGGRGTTVTSIESAAPARAGGAPAKPAP